MNTADSNKPVPRSKTGRFVKGHSGNPNGCPKSLPEVRQALTELTPAAIATIARVFNDPNLTNRDALAASRLVLEFLLPKPAVQADAGPQNLDRLIALMSQPAQTTSPVSAR